ncbi:MAG: hypothetical protein V3V24_09820 [Nitrospinaceae bacterium]
MTTKPTDKELRKMAQILIHQGDEDMVMALEFKPLAQALLDRMGKDAEAVYLIDGAFGIMNSRGYAKKWVKRAVDFLQPKGST